MKILHSGFDGLEISYRTTLPENILGILTSAKQQAAQSRRDSAIVLGGRSVIVKATGAAGGYSFTVDTGELGATWFFKEGNASDPWSARVSAKSLPLALFGPTKFVDASQGFLHQIGCDFGVNDCRVTRVDYALDFSDPEFEINKDHFVCHSRQKKNYIDSIDIIDVSNKTISIRIGKMPSYQIAIYDKRKDAIDKNKTYWWDIWQQNSEVLLNRGLTVWRIEARLGKKALNNALKLRDWPTVAASIASLLQTTTSKIRMVIPSADTNRARWANAPVWDRYRGALREIVVNTPTNLDAGSILQALKAERLEHLEHQRLGIEISIAAAEGVRSSEYDVFLMRKMNQSLARKRQLGHKFADELSEREEVWLARHSVG
ncbi:hypothetical protein [Hyphomonas sp.]|uniref:hypothetical protein n=1 Tax=Hyphomonas sp. TaxID=87 RepID=UPI003D2BCC7D